MDIEEIACADYEIRFDILVSRFDRAIQSLAEISIAFDTALQKLISNREILADEIIYDCVLVVAIADEEPFPGCLTNISIGDYKLKVDYKSFL